MLRPHQIFFSRLCDSDLAKNRGSSSILSRQPLKIESQYSLMVKLENGSEFVLEIQDYLSYPPDFFYFPHI